MKSDCDWLRGELALLAFGALQEEIPEAQWPAFRPACETHLQGCASCRDQLARLRAEDEARLLAAPHLDPPPYLWARVESRIREEAGARCSLQSVAERVWIPAGDGVEISQLWVDSEAERHSLLVRMRAGGRLPLHRHVGPEECFVAHGDLDDGHVQLRAGDYARFEAGTQHAVTTDGGCTLFVTASLRDSAMQRA